MKITLNSPLSFCQKGQRGNQEDARYPDCDRPGSGQRSFIVCDGVGGQDKGEVASATVAAAMGNYMEHFDLNRPFTSDDFKRVLDYGYRELYAAMNRETRDMATTLTFLCFHSGGATVAHMGDSRVYQVRPGVGIIHMTSDHSLVNALVRSGNITPEEAINHPQSNYITRCMNYVDADHERPAADLIVLTDIEPGDYFFMCTDGVTHCVDDEQLTDILDSDASDEKKMQTIADLSRNSSDNNTAILVSVKSVEGEPESAGRELGAGPNTYSLPCNTDKITEVQSSPSPSIASRIASFFKRLF